MEIEMQQFFDMAYNFNAFSYDNVNRYLYDLNGTRHSSTSELKQQIGEK